MVLIKEQHGSASRLVGCGWHHGLVAPGGGDGGRCRIIVNGVTCLACLQRAALRMRLDKKDRPFLQCGACAAILFVRGEIPILTAFAAMQLLEQAGAAEWVRTEAYRTAMAPGGLAAVISACAPTLLTAAAPATDARLMSIAGATR
jgi:hypothetical protein